MIGVTSAWYLLKAGHEVTVIDRQPAAALETSFANGGQISVSHAEPWANPAAPAKILRWLGREDAPLLFRPHADWHQWWWGVRFLMECLPSRARSNTRQILAIALYSRDCLHGLLQETAIRYDREARGILHLFTEQAAYARARAEVAEYRARGLDMQVLDRGGCMATEPALNGATAHIVGGLFAPSDESGDARTFTQNLSTLAARSGVRFRFETAVEFIEVSRKGVASVAVRNVDGSDDRLRADAYVVALGSYSPQFLAPIGISIPVYPVKGYSVTIPLDDADVAPRVSITDEDYKIVFTRLGQRLRVAGTAELSGYSTEINVPRCEAIGRRAAAFFPQLSHFERAEYWTGLRPATPSNVPCVGRTRYPNLFLNTGHGTLGWTLACGSAAALADIISGRAPALSLVSR